MGIRTRIGGAGGPALHYTTLHYTTLHYTSLHNGMLRYATLHFTKMSCYILHYIGLYLNTLVYTTIHQILPYSRASYPVSSGHLATGPECRYLQLPFQSRREVRMAGVAEHSTFYALKHESQTLKELSSPSFPAGAI